MLHSRITFIVSRVSGCVYCIVSRCVVLCLLCGLYIEVGIGLVLHFFPRKLESSGEVLVLDVL